LTDSLSKQDNETRARKSPAGRESHPYRQTTSHPPDTKDTVAIAQGTLPVTVESPLVLNYKVNDEPPSSDKYQDKMLRTGLKPMESVLKVID
jgi:hypothetical protein